MSAHGTVPPSASGHPLVSVCIPTFNSGELAIRAVRSALGQDYPSIEAVVVDDASTDNTPRRLHAEFGSRITLVVKRSRTGQARTANLAIGRSNGVLVKFLDHDDELDANCVSQMVPALLTHAAVGIAFARRRIELASTTAAEGREWFERFGEVHRGFARLESVNRGSELFRQMLDAHLRWNWIGEPSSVMVRRSCLDAVGGFSPRTRQGIDLDLWLRILAEYDAAFVDKELSTYRHSGESLTARNAATGENWLDRLWILENLMSNPETSERYPELGRLRTQERHMAWRAALRGMLGLAANSAPPKPWLEYLAYRLRSGVSAVAISGEAATRLVSH
jgi:glycosyltransferase involved in cell wall biosynthesis